MSAGLRDAEYLGTKAVPHDDEVDPEIHSHIRQLSCYAGARSDCNDSIYPVYLCIQKSRRRVWVDCAEVRT